MQSKIAKIDNRHPITIAFDCAIKTGRVTPESIDAWKKDMIDLVGESAKKFVGFSDTAAIRRALDIMLGILSLPVVHSTEGKLDPEAWVKYLVDTSLKAIATEAIAMARVTAESLDETELTAYPRGSTTRSRLIDYATSRDRDRKEVWVGYQLYRRDVEDQKREHIEAELVKWLIKKFANVEPHVWVGRLRRTSFELCGMDATPLVADVLNTYLLRFCTGLSTKGDIILKKKDFQQIRTAYEADRKLWVKSAYQRYNTLVKQIPLGLRSGLADQGKGNWSKVHLNSGPPRVPKLWSDKKPIYAITGVYHYQVLG